jgi:hypothetical protein
MLMPTANSPWSDLMHRSRLGLALVFLATACGPSAAPTPAPRPDQGASPAEIRAAGSLITPAKVLSRLSIIADDSMGGRNTPSSGLEKTAQYLADNYRAWGLLPAGEDSSWFQRYPLQRLRLNPAESWFEVDAAGTISHFTFTRWVTVSGPMTGQVLSGALEIISGAVTAADVESLDISGKIVLFVQNAARPTENAFVSRALRAKRPVAIVNLVNSDPVAFDARVVRARTTSPRVTVAGMPNTSAVELTIHDSILAGDPNTPNNPDWNQLRALPTPVLIGSPDGVYASIKVVGTSIDSGSAPNVVAMARGTDPLLRDEYVVFSGHMDHVGTVGDGVGGCNPLTRPDSTVDNICNGADDDGSGTIGVMSVAEAVAKLNGHTRRSIVVLNVSGEEKGLWGSGYFAEHPTVPMGKVVADINLDMIGRNSPDSIVVIGKEHSDMGETLARVQAAHPELKLVGSDDIWPTENFYARSDHFNFARKGVPVLFFFNGVHDQYHKADDEVRLIDGSKLARVAQLAFYLGVEIANTTARPAWNPASYQTIVVEQKVPPVVVKKP